MIIGIHTQDGIATDYPERWRQFLEERGHQGEWIDLTRVETLDSLKRFDAIMCRWSLSHPGRTVMPGLLDLLEDEFRILVYPDRKTRWSWDDKVKQFHLLNGRNIRMPATWIFTDREEALEWSLSASYPIVFKLASGASSRNVILIRNWREAARLIHRMFTGGIGSHRDLVTVRDPWNLGRRISSLKRYVMDHDRWLHDRMKETIEKSYAYFQELITDNAFDTRISIIGDRAFGFRRFNRDNDFRASGSGRISWDPEGIDKQTVQMAFQISEMLGFQCMAYDFVRNVNGEWFVLETCWTFADWAVQKCPGYWDRNLNWIGRSMWPEEAQVEDLIRLLKLRNPSLTK